MIQPGEYKGEIIDASMNESDDGKVYALAKLRPDNMNEAVTWFGSFSDTIISAGFNEGKSVGDVTAATLGSIGWNADFTSLKTIIGRMVTFGVKHEPDRKKQGEVRAKVSYIKPIGTGKPVSGASARELAAKFKGAAIEAARNAPKDQPTSGSKAPATNGSKAPASGGGGYDDHNYGGNSADDDIPFIVNVSLEPTERWNR